jgi:preprotein translocase subunit YajC
VNSSFGAALPLLLLALAFVVLIVLPQRARSRVALRTQQLQDSLTVGTEIMTTSGLYGRVTALDERTLDLEVAPGVVVRWARAAVGEVHGAEPTEQPPASEPVEE